MSHCLVVFTATFPAGTMDSFIHEELPYTAAQFDDVLIFPVNAVGALSRPDPRLPQNCVAYLTNQRGRIGGRLRDIAYLSGATFKRASYFLREREKKPKALKTKYFCSISKAGQRRRQMIFGGCSNHCCVRMKR